MLSAIELQIISTCR